jgi:hypothetical protein
VKDGFSALVAVGIGLIPVEEVRDFIVNKTSQIAGTVESAGTRRLPSKTVAVASMQELIGDAAYGT